MVKKTILVSGGTKGIGRAIVEKFAESGFDVITCSRSLNDLTEQKRDYSTRFPNQNFDFLACDLGNKKGRHDLVNFLKNKEIDVLVNNTGVFVPGSIHQEEEGTLEKMIETNLYSAYDISRAVVPQMKSRMNGYIFNICSTASIMAYENGGSYCISKFALLGFSKVLRAELRNFHIKVTSILPGATFTSSWEGVEIPESRFMPSSDIADAVWNAYQMSPRTVVEEILLRPQLGDL